jgi:hypothetical protein
VQTAAGLAIGSAFDTYDMSDVSYPQIRNPS